MTEIKLKVTAAIAHLDPIYLSSSNWCTSAQESTDGEKIRLHLLTLMDLKGLLCLAWHMQNVGLHGKFVINSDILLIAECYCLSDNQPTVCR